MQILEFVMDGARVVDVIRSGLLEGAGGEERRRLGGCGMDRGSWLYHTVSVIYVGVFFFFIMHSVGCLVSPVVRI